MWEFTQAELAFLLGFRDRATISRLERHERAHTIIVALSYEIIFRVRPREMYPGLYYELRANVVDRMRELSETLESARVTKRTAAKLQLLRDTLARIDQDVQSV